MLGIIHLSPPVNNFDSETPLVFLQYTPLVLLQYTPLVLFTRFPFPPWNEKKKFGILFLNS